MANIILICEGATDGLDVRVLDAVIAQKLGKEVTIRAAGGDRGLGSVATFLEEQSKQRYGGKGDEVFTIEDRNYKSRLEADESWGEKSKRFIWRRHEIENYLLEPDVVAVAIGNLPKSKTTTLLESKEGVESLLQSLATEMLEDHAGWLTYNHLVEKLNPLRLKFSGLGGGLQPRDEWLKHLKSECSRLKQAATKMPQISELAPSEVEQFYDRMLDQLRQPSFLSNGQYLLDLRGKELLDRLYNAIRGSLQIKTTDPKQNPKATFQGKLIKALEQQYRQGYFIPDDFAELAKRL